MYGNCVDQQFVKFSNSHEAFMVAEITFSFCLCNSRAHFDLHRLHRSARLHHEAHHHVFSTKSRRTFFRLYPRLGFSVWHKRGVSRCVDAAVSSMLLSVFELTGRCQWDGMMAARRTATAMGFSPTAMPDAARVFVGSLHCWFCRQ